VPGSAPPAPTRGTPQSIEPQSFIDRRGITKARGNIRLPRAVFGYQDLAQRAEAALANQLVLGGHGFQAPRTWLEPIIVLAADSPSGLIATASTTYAKH
jgi:hypothetical protein